MAHHSTEDEKQYHQVAQEFKGFMCALGTKLAILQNLLSDDAEDKIAEVLRFISVFDDTFGEVNMKKVCKTIGNNIIVNESNVNSWKLYISLANESLAKAGLRKIKQEQEEMTCHTTENHDSTPSISTTSCTSPISNTNLENTNNIDRMESDSPSIAPRFQTNNTTRKRRFTCKELASQNKEGFVQVKFRI